MKPQFVCNISSIHCIREILVDKMSQEYIIRIDQQNENKM
jgi:hypothetical protein